MTEEIWIADDIAEIRVPDVTSAQGVARRLRQTPFPFTEVVPGFDRVAVMFDPLTTTGQEVSSALSAALAGLRDEIPEERPVQIIRVQYGGEAGPDFDAVCDQVGLAAEAFIAAHTSVIHRVDLMGFTPGFAYISGVPEKWQVGRLAAPRAHVAAGSVGLISGFTGLYALEGPGGWPLIGRTSHPLFQPQADEPFALSAGQKIRFEAA